MATKTVYDIPESATRTVELANARLLVTLMRVDDGSLVGYVTLDIGGKTLESRVDALGFTGAQVTAFETQLKALAKKLVEVKGGVARVVTVEETP